jgi:uncharacterized metal-binding protein YceD (DUF177 family)
MVKFSKIDDNEFSRVLSAPRQAQLPMTVEISADRRDCAALALRFGLLDIASLTASLTVVDDAKPGQVLIKGRLAATLTQACVVTLQPLGAQLAEGFEATFAVEGAEEVSASQAFELEEDQPEPFGPEGIDLGELVAQQLMVALDPYPRAGDVQVAAEWAAPRQEKIVKKSPFAVLKEMKENS